MEQQPEPAAPEPTTAEPTTAGAEGAEASDIVEVPVARFAAGPAWSRMDPQTEWIVLIGAVGVFLAAAILPMPEGDEVRLFGQPLPPLCPSRAAGFSCPGCGMTRAIICWVHGDPSAGLGFHRLSLLALLLIGGQIPYRIWRLRGGPPVPERVSDAILVGFPLLLFVNWLIGFVI